MSLKSKLEAVIYAAEEPVTLTQLATLFGCGSTGMESSSGRRRPEGCGRDRIQRNRPLSSPLIDEGLEYLDLRTEDGRPLGEPESAAPGIRRTVQDRARRTGRTRHRSRSRTRFRNDQSVSETGQAGSAELAPAEQATLDPEAEAKRAARQRDREIKAILRQLIDELIAFYASDDRGVEIREIAGGYRMATKPECHDAVRMFIKSLKPALKLSLPALETLAVIAYKQPVTAPEVNEIRGVDSSGVFGSLLARKLITTAGRKQVIGRPILYKTTKEFLMRFGLKDVAELPSMDEFEKMASELEEVEPAAVDEADVATAAYDAEGVTEPAAGRKRTGRPGVPADRSWSVG